MKRQMWLAAGVATALVVGGVAVAQARGPWGQGGGAAAGASAGAGWEPGMMAAGWGPGPGMTAAGWGAGPGAGGGMMGGGRGAGHGMMGAGGAGAGFCGGPGAATYDPAVVSSRTDYMLAEAQSALTGLQAQLGAATDDTVKARLTERIERQTLEIGRLTAEAAVWKTQPKTWLEGATAVAQANVDYWSQATATAATNKAWIALRLAQARQQLANLQAQSSSPTN